MPKSDCILSKSSVPKIRTADRLQGGLQQVLRGVLAIALLCGSAAVGAERPHIPQVVFGSDFLSYHPDMKYRFKGMDALERGADEQAFAFFRKAARFADKESQAMVAEMLWEGRGTQTDRALAYAWMDLAAERHYPVFLKLREHYWSQLTEVERDAALERGERVYLEFGDVAAKPRLESRLRRMKANVTGSRVGALGGALDVYVLNSAGTFVPVPDTLVYQTRYFRAEEYWQWQDERMLSPQLGTVEVGALEELGDGTSVEPDE